MNLILIRHGKTDANERHLYCGSTDIPLSETGKKELVVRKESTDYPCLSAIGDPCLKDPWTFRHRVGAAGSTKIEPLVTPCGRDMRLKMNIVTSGMLRCEETLAILYGDIPHTIIPAFKEMNFGNFEMHSYEELKTDADYLNWITGDNEANLTPGGESGNIMKKRVITALEKLMETNTDTLLITHGGVIAAIMDYLFPEEAKNRYEWQPDYGGGYRIDLDTRTYDQI